MKCRLDRAVERFRRRLRTALLIGGAAAALALAGPGRYAVDRMLPVLRTHRRAYGAAALLLAAVSASVTLLTRS